MDNNKIPRVCSICGASEVELERYGDLHDPEYLCPYCYNSFGADSEVRNLSSMMNVLEQRLKKHMDQCFARGQLSEERLRKLRELKDVPMETRPFVIE